MKIGLLNFHASHNYGSMLLSYALQEALKSFGAEVKIINMRILAQQMLYDNPLKFRTFFQIKSLLRNPFLFWANTKQWYKFESFQQTKYQLTREVHTLKECEDLIKEEGFDMVISGGDQIWNMQCTDWSIAYYLPFDIEGVKRMSYSCSFGGNTVFRYENYALIIDSLLDHYDIISVREEAAMKFFSPRIKKNIRQVCDPIFLFEKKYYEKICGDTPIYKKNKYIFYYSPFSDENAEIDAVKLSKKMGLPIVTSNKAYFNHKGMRYVSNIGPLEFLNLIRHAEFICGKSFHLVVFSALFNKQFMLFSSRDSRIDCILKTLNISDRFYYETTDLFKDIDWNSVNERIALMRTDAFKFLENCLNR